MSGNFEVMPVGTAARLKALEAENLKMTGQNDALVCALLSAREVISMIKEAQQAEPVAVTDFQQMLVDAGLVDPAAIDDPDGYDGGFTLAQINELHARLAEGQR